MHAKAKGLDVRVLHGEPRPCAAKGRGSVVPAAFARIREHSLRDAPPDPAPPLACLCAAAGRQGRVEAQPPQPGVARPNGVYGEQGVKARCQGVVQHVQPALQVASRSPRVQGGRGGEPCRRTRHRHARTHTSPKARSVHLLTHAAPVPCNCPTHAAVGHGPQRAKVPCNCPTHAVAMRRFGAPRGR